MANATPLPNKAEQRRQESIARRKQNVAGALAESGPDVALMPQMPTGMQALRAALPRELIDAGQIAFDQLSQPKVASYDPSLLAPNPQRARVADHGLDELAASLSANGQQEPILARLITNTDRQRWPEAFGAEQLLMILKGHRIFKAQPKSNLTLLRVELLLPLDQETDLDYSRRALRRASIRMMHSQAYDIFDKVNLYLIWREEFAIAAPKDTEIAAYFEISRTEAQRVRRVAEMDEGVADKIKTADRKPADEIIFTIASKPKEQQGEAYKRIGHLTVAAVRSLEQADKPKQLAEVRSGRPSNFLLRVHDRGLGISSFTTSLTAQQWRERGGAKAFWDAVRAIVNDRETQDRLQDELG